MAEILKEWLSERLQRPINWNPEDFGDIMKNGCMIASVLYSYHVINDDKYFLMKSSNAREDINNNWEHLSVWLKDIEIVLSDVDLVKIKEGKGSSLLHLFYHLFLQLDKKDRIDFIKREKKMVSELVEKLEHRFKVTDVPKEKESIVDDLSRPLLNERHFIEWQKKKVAQVQNTYDYMRHKYSKMLSKADDTQIPKQSVPFKCIKKTTTADTKKDIERFSKRYPCKFENFTYEQLMAMEEKAIERKKSFTDSEWVNNYMTNLYTKMRKSTDTEEFQEQMNNILSGSLWDLSINEEERKLEIELAKKVMKLSQFEKEMCNQIMETKQQARNLIHNRIVGEKEFTEQREQQFNQFLDNVKEQIQLEVAEIDFEKQRQNMLHKKLYAEKMKRKRKHYYEICYEVMLAIVDYAIKYAYFRKLIGNDIPGHFIHEWKTLYYKQQPIFDVLEPVENVLKEPGIEAESIPEEIARHELDRQEVLNDCKFNEYHNYSGPWTLDTLIPNYDPESDERKYENLGTRILGHVVYKLLEIKYPYPPARPPAALPKFTAKVLLRGLPDRSIIVPMEFLLKNQKIFVVRLESAINFCLRKFKSEMVGCSDIELSFEKFINAAQKEEEKQLIKLLKSEDDVTNKNSDAAVIAMLGTIPPNVKQTQTPKTIPEEEIMLSSAAHLGKYTYQCLYSGDSLTDHLIAAILVEYIKDQSDINGFVIINYPNTYREAQILEETFSGFAPPDEALLDDNDDIFLEETIKKHRKKEVDEYEKVRVSKIVSNPHKNVIQKPFESYFTCYIHLKETQDILQEIVIWDLNEENSELIDRFYAALGINYSMYYEVIDKEFLIHLCRYIIGDFLKSCNSLFGTKTLSDLDFPSTEDKRTKSKTIKPLVNGKSKDKLRRGSKTARSKISIVSYMEVVKSPDKSTENVANESTVLLEKEEERVKTSTVTDIIKISAGVEDWHYAEIPIPEIIGVALASCWEVIEKVYVEDIQHLLFSKRLQMNCLIPYTTFIKDKMDQIITMPSEKPNLVCQFQKDYNGFENDWRDINISKNEWHCRVKELQNRLYKICDDRKLFAEQQRQSLICENWALEELTTMVNTYISCMQAELNRSMLTFQTLHDFYFAMLKRMLPSERITSKELTKIYRDAEDTSGSKKSGEDKIFRQLKNAFQELQMKNVEIDYSNNPFNMFVENNVKIALKIIKDANDKYRSIISKEYGEIAKNVIPLKKKDEITSLETISPEEIFKENALKCIEEWTMGANGEMYRASLRLTVLQFKCYQDMKLFSNQIYKTFVGVQEYINSYYLNEIKSVDRLCKYIQMAIEQGRRIPESLILEYDKFIIDPNLLQFAPSGPPTGSYVMEENVQYSEFKLNQLAKLRSLFKIVAPTGIALQQVFIYVLQDFIVFGKENSDGPIFPETWVNVNPEQVPKLVFLLFGETCYVDWRDFLIYCLNIRFPTTEELLELRQKLRCCDLESKELVSRDNFLAQTFWFDEDFDHNDNSANLRCCLIKHFIFELYEVEEDSMNYPALLLALCKNKNPVEGFAAALSMAVGKKVCFDFEECKEIICKLIKDKKYRDSCLACARSCAQKILDNVINAVVKTCEGTTVMELEYEEEAVVEKKLKKGKAGSPRKTKRMESDSARAVKPSKLLISKTQISKSETDTKKTFICPPCAAEEKEEYDEDKEIVEEEHNLEPIPDPDIVYAVSQQVIWNVLKICLPGLFGILPEKGKSPFVDQVEEIIKKLEVDTETGDIYVCKFVTEKNILKLLHKVKKFTALNLVEQVMKLQK